MPKSEMTQFMVKNGCMLSCGRLPPAVGIILGFMEVSTLDGTTYNSVLLDPGRFAPGEFEPDDFELTAG